MLHGATVFYIHGLQLREICIATCTEPLDPATESQVMLGHLRTLMLDLDWWGGYMDFPPATKPATFGEPLTFQWNWS